ncbi:MAG: hypothetical protein AB8B58_04815 [Roseobacter sp.]
MRFWVLFLLFIGSSARAECDAPVCLIDPDSLVLSRIITFDNAHAGYGPGQPVRDLLVLDGASFGERFAGQTITADGNHDKVSGRPLPPLTLMPGVKGQNLSVVYFGGNNVLNGYGVAGFPRRHAQGEGAIAFAFENDQSALAFHIRGGEAGTVQVMFLRRDASIIHQMILPPAGEHAFGFVRQENIDDIAGVVITNVDPEGLAIDNLRFGRPPNLS